ncbi:hypothetical protein [Myxosarcina sp. GI1]|uniref:hypothetical protein n=1 Tax=Myxosarcina sp. GI1 TaxID=1541065 RepID=UPI00068BA11C|nr:hypothetical protein [Myxosarcina sp. GI1]
MLIDSQSKTNSTSLQELCSSLVICQTNKTDSEFVVYLGCKQDEVSGYLKTLKTLYRCELCEVHEPLHLSGFEAEIEIHQMQRYSDPSAFGLDYLTESQQLRDLGCNHEEYDYYTTGFQQRW